MFSYWSIQMSSPTNVYEDASEGSLMSTAQTVWDNCTTKFIPQGSEFFQIATELVTVIVMLAVENVTNILI